MRGSLSKIQTERIERLENKEKWSKKSTRSTFHKSWIMPERDLILVTKTVYDEFVLYSKFYFMNNSGYSLRLF